MFFSPSFQSIFVLDFAIFMVNPSGIYIVLPSAPINANNVVYRTGLRPAGDGLLLTTLPTLRTGLAILWLRRHKEKFCETSP